MKKLYLLITVVLITSVVLMSTVQATQWATGIQFDLGDSSSTTGRIEGINALGEPDDLFLSLGYDDNGYGGWAVFDFGSLFDTQAVVIETTNGNPNNWREYAEVWVSPGTDPLESTDFVWVTDINNFSGSTVDLTSVAGSPFRYLKIVDTTMENQGHIGDGFDVNAVGVNPVPEPATMMLFGIGLLGLAGVSRRKR